MFKPKVGSVHTISDLKIENRTVRSYSDLKAAIVENAGVPLAVAVKLTDHKLCMGGGPVGRLKNGGLGGTLLFPFDDIVVEGVIFKRFGKIKFKVTRV